MRWQALLIACGLIKQEATEHEAAQWPHYTIHQLRHTPGSQFIARFPDEMVSRVLGHADPKSTRIYADFNED